MDTGLNAPSGTHNVPNASLKRQAVGVNINAVNRVLPFGRSTDIPKEAENDL
jgi:hypothetical protein